MFGELLSSLGGNLINFVQSSKNNEVVRRLFIQECQYNLSLLSILDWKWTDEAFPKYIVSNLKSDISTVMLCNYKNDFLNLTVNQFTKFIKSNDLVKESESNDIIIQIVNKILVLKVIAAMPEVLLKNDKSNFQKRISNLRKVLIFIINLIEKKNKQ